MDVTLDAAAAFPMHVRVDVSTGYSCCILSWKEAPVAVPQPKVDEPLPYEYWRVKDEMTPFFHRLPSFGEQDEADA